MTRHDQCPMVLYAQTVGVIRLDVDGCCTDISDSARRILSLPSAMIGDSYTEWPLAAEVRQLIDAMVGGKVEEGQPAIFADQTIADPASDVGYLSFATQLCDAGVEVFVIERPSVRYAIGANQYAHAATLAQVAAGVAHEVRNPLTAVKGFLQLLSEHHEPRYVQVALQEVDRAVRILNSLLSISRPDDDDEEMVPVDVCAMMDSVALLFEDHFYSIRVRKAYDEPDVAIRAKPEKLKKALFNLVKNAIEAMPSGGILSLEQRVVRGYTTLSVRDTGGGIAHDILVKLGTPFVTSKIGGTGLGVALVHNMMSELGGRMDVESSRDGSSFTLYFPLTVRSEASEALKLSDSTVPTQAIPSLHPVEVFRESRSELVYARAESAAAIADATEEHPYTRDRSTPRSSDDKDGESAFPSEWVRAFVPVTALTERVRLVTVTPSVLDRSVLHAMGPFVEAAVRTVTEQLQGEASRSRLQVVIDVTHVDATDSMFPILCQSFEQVMRSFGHGFVFAGITAQGAVSLREQLDGDGMFSVYETVTAALHDLGLITSAL